jgi:hypothetical protein
MEKSEDRLRRTWRSLEQALDQALDQVSPLTGFSELFSTSFPIGPAVAYDLPRLRRLTDTRAT